MNCKCDALKHRERRKMKTKPNTPINQVQWLDFQKHHQKLKEIFNILATWIKNNEEWRNPIWPWTNPMSYMRASAGDRQLLNWDAPGRRRNHIHQINCWTLSAFQSECSYEKQEEKETWEGRRTWERARSITHWSGTWSLFLSYGSKVVEQLVCSW